MSENSLNKQFNKSLEEEDEEKITQRSNHRKIFSHAYITNNTFTASLMRFVKMMKFKQI